jgi:hypothetical protein
MAAIETGWGTQIRQSCRNSFVFISLLASTLEAVRLLVFLAFRWTESAWIPDVLATMDVNTSMDFRGSTDAAVAYLRRHNPCASNCFACL